MQPWFERVSVPPDRSWLLFDRRLPEFPFNWHYHPEFELTLTLNSRGMRFIGDHVDRYDDGDLALLGPDLPHAWQSEATVASGGEHRDCTLVHPRLDRGDARADAGARAAPADARRRRARARLRQGRAGGGAQEPDGAGRDAGGAAGAGPARGAARSRGDAERRTLAAGEMAIGAAPRDRARMARVLAWLHGHYLEPLRLEPLTVIAHLSESQLQRMFRRRARMSLSAYLTQLLVGHACRLLIQTDRTIGQIAAETGFSDATHFARHFRAAKGVTASRYRATFRAEPSADAQSR